MRAERIDPALWEAVRAELERVIELAPAERARAVAGLAPELRRTVEALLRAEPASRAFDRVPPAVRRRHDTQG